MIEMRPSRPEEIPGEKALWKLAFGDRDRDIDAFYRRCGGHRDMMVLLEDGVLRSMLALLPVEIVLPDGASASSAYVYALATDPEARNRGHGRQLLNYVDFYLQERGIDCVTVVPAEAGLHKFFATAGFSECFTTRKQELLRGKEAPAEAADVLTDVAAQEYLALRERLLAGTFHAAYGHALVEYQQELSRESGAGLYRIAVDGQEGCAVAEYTGEESLAVKELLIAPGLMERAMDLIKAELPAARYFVRTPALWEGLPGSYIQTFAMLKWYNEEKRGRWYEETSGYFGLAFD